MRGDPVEWKTGSTRSALRLKAKIRLVAKGGRTGSARSKDLRCPVALEEWQERSNCCPPEWQQQYKTRQAGESSERDYSRLEYSRRRDPCVCES